MKQVKLNQMQKKYIREISAESRKINPIYKYKLLKTTLAKNGEPVLHWQVTPLDTLFEKNGHVYHMTEQLDERGDVVEQVREYSFKPFWLDHDRPENIRFPCQVIMHLDNIELVKNITS